MAVVDVINCTGEKVSEANLPEEIFNVPVKSSVLHDVVRMQLSNRRSGTASVKHRSDIQGSTRKLFRQKGTGRARRGNIKSPLLRGGGVVFGPDNRSYKIKLPKKVRKLALKMALSAKLKENHLMVLDKFDLDEIKTKKFLAVTKAIDVKNGLFVTDKKDEKLELSSRNVPKMKILRTEGLNVYDILKYERLILLESTLSGIEGRLGS
jgi:large subunit ribosomal protein L4